MTNNEIIGQFIKFMNALLDKVEPAMNNGLITQEERTQLASIAERVATLEQKEDKVGVSSEEMGRAIATAISLLPPDQVGVSEERVEELIAGIESYNDAELREKIRLLEGRSVAAGVTEQHVFEIVEGELNKRYEFLEMALKELLKAIFEIAKGLAELPNNDVESLKAIGKETKDKYNHLMPYLD